MVDNPEQTVSLQGRIVDAAREEFFAHGFRNVTMDDLSRQLGISKKTLYQFYPSKRHLLEAVLKQKFSEVEADIDREAARTPGDFGTTLQNLLQRVQFHSREISPAFIRDIQKEAPDLFQLVQDRRQTLIVKHFGTLFAEGAAAGLIRSDIPPHLLTAILLGVTNAVVNPTMLSTLGIAPSEAYAAVMSVVLHGVLVSKSDEVQP